MRVGSRTNQVSSSIKGFSLVGVLVSATIASIVMLNLMRTTHAFYKAERGISSNFDLTDLAMTIRRLTENTTICGRSGLINVDISPLLTPTASPVPVDLTYPGAPPLTAGVQFTSRKIEQLALTSLTPAGVSGQYLANLHVSTSLTGEGVTTRKPFNDFLLLVAVNGTNKITQCGGSSLGSPTPPTTEPGIPGGRLTLQSGAPIPNVDIIGTSTVYYTPYLSDRIALYDNSSWVLYSLSEISVSVPVIPDANYDVFVYNNSGALTLELGQKWNGNKLRAVPLGSQNGVWVKASDPTHRYVGTVRNSTVGKLEDSNASRFVWNMYNQVMRKMKVFPPMNSTHAINGNWTQVFGDYCAQWVIGVPGQSMATAHASLYVVSSPQSCTAWTGIGINNNTDASDTNGQVAPVVGSGNYATADIVYSPDVGWGWFQWLASNSGCNQTFKATKNSALVGYIGL